MTIDFESTNTTVRSWLLARQTGDLLRTCMDQLFRKYNITTEQYEVLVSIRYLADYVNITDIAIWLRRSTNSVSMIVERMVKGGLVRRVRDKSDRRVVRLVTTNKGENILELASPAYWETIKEMLLPLSHEDKRAYIGLSEMINYKALEFLNPGEDIEAMVRDRAKRHAKFMQRLPPYALIPIPEVKRQRAKKKKAI